jgi:hypothetical protein
MGKSIEKRGSLELIWQDGATIYDELSTGKDNAALLFLYILSVNLQVIFMLYSVKSCIYVKSSVAT